MKKIHIGGVYYGCHNIGDEAILRSMIETFQVMGEVSVSTYGSEWIKNEYTNVELRPIKINYAKPKLGMYVLPRRNFLSNIKRLGDEIRYIKDKDIYVCGGATILSDCPWYSLRTVQIANKAHIPSILWGVGMAEGVDDKTKKYIKKICSAPYMKHIFVRDELVKERLVQIGICESKISVCYDPAFMIKAEKFELSQYLSRQQIDLYNSDRVKVIVSVSGEGDIAGKTDLGQLTNAIEKIIDDFNAVVFLVPTGCGQHCKDTEMMRTLITRPEITLIENEFQPQHLIQFLKGIDGVISSRLHMNIFAAVANTPSISLVRNSKLTDFASLFELPYINIVGMTSEQIYRDFVEMYNTLPQKKEVMKKRLLYQREQYNVAKKKAEQMIQTD